MVQLQSTSGRQEPQPPRSGYGFLAYILDGLHEQPLLDTLQQYRRTGRPGYPIRAMWRAYLVKFLLKIPYNNELLERLRGSRSLRQICGFSDAIPSESALSRFVSRLGFHTDLVKDILVEVTNRLRGLLPANPPLGQTVAIDSTLFPTYSNPNRKHVTDPDARWGVKHSARSKDGGKEWGWGYKMHLLSDSNYGLPLDFIITPANENDSPMLPSVVQEARARYPWLHPKYLLADRGYDSAANHQALVQQGITPVIHLRKPTRGDLHDGIYTTDGVPTCLGQVGMEYVETDPESGHHLFRCRQGSCPLQSTGGGLHRCDSEVWEDPADNLRVIGMLARSSPLWKRLYRQRMSIERVFRSLKHSRGLERHCARGMRKIMLQATMSVLTFQGTVLARLRAGDLADIRNMAVKVT